MSGFYLLTPRALLAKAQREVVDFHETSALERLFDACCTLNHLRDWICPDAENRHKLQSWPNGPEERFADELWKMNEYKVVRALCNRAKHFVITKSGPNPTTDVVHGAAVGLLRTGDAVLIYYLVGLAGTACYDVRDVLLALLRAYLTYFNARDERRS